MSGFFEPLVEVVRGDLTEAVHVGSVAVVDRTGELLASVGDPKAYVTYWRSAAKPFQSMPLVYSGAADSFAFSDQDLALCCGSHSAEPAHTQRVAALLGRLDLSVDDLACGVHPPLNREAAEELIRSGTQPTRAHSNCSGLHAGMLALARHLGVSTEDYERPEHQVQQEILANVCRFTGLEPEAVVDGIDGCDAPTYGISLYRMALAYARTGSPEGIEEPFASSATHIRRAMVAHPFSVAGTGRFDTFLMESSQGALLAKGGASGVHCVSTDDGIGIALKVTDGGGGPTDPGRPTEVGMIEVLRQLGLLTWQQLDGLAERARPPVRTASGREAGEMRPAFRL